MVHQRLDILRLVHVAHKCLGTIARLPLNVRLGGGQPLRVVAAEHNSGALPGQLRGDPLAQTGGGRHAQSYLTLQAEIHNNTSSIG